MAKNRIIYLLTWIGCVVFFCAYRQWLAWYTLVAVTCLPVFSLLVSLPAMGKARLETELPPAVTMGDAVDFRPRCEMPLWRCRVTARRPMTGERWVQKRGKALPTDHCGAIVLTFERPRVCDYLGLLGLPLGCPRQMELLVRPVPADSEELPELNRESLWRPKAGGGFSENHELRLYRPGDPVRQIHWKLSGKTGKLIFREPVGQLQLGLDLNGTPDELDRKLGRLLWLGNQLLDRNLHFDIRCRTGDGTVLRSVTCHETMMQAVDALLRCPRAADGSSQARGELYIGGGTDEA